MRLQGRFIKHEQFKDVFFEVNKASEYLDTFILEGYWHNLGFVRSYSLGKRDTLRIPTDHMKQWMWCTEPKVECVRYTQWMYCD